MRAAILTVLLATLATPGSVLGQPGGVPSGTRIDWNTQADGWRGRNGERLTLVCPGGGTLSSRLWGTDNYTDDSSICTAAVHAGLITPARGGTITIEIAPGATSYQSSTRNGVSSRDYGAWHGSFRFVSSGSSTGGGGSGGGTQGSSQAADWNTQANSWRGQNNKRFTLSCPAGGLVSNRLWGTDTYTDDSSICTAAVHAGLINTSQGGTVTIEIVPGASSYRGSTRNGVASLDYGAWDGSFRFVGAGGLNQGGGGQGSAQAASWATQANGWRGQNNRRFTLSCPAGGSVSNRLWGTDTYTDDSSICTAAVHAGLINTSQGGTVTIEIVPGASSYRGSTRNGVASLDYGAWDGSFRFVGAGGLNQGGGGQGSAQAASWVTQANGWRGQNNRRFTLSCPAGGSVSNRLWGTDTYTDDSSICTAAVHAGLITATAGGIVTIEIRPGASSYRGTVRNGVSSRDYGAFGGSFVFVLQ